MKKSFVKWLFIGLLFLFIVFPQIYVLQSGIQYSHGININIWQATGNSLGIALCVATLSCGIALLCGIGLVYTNIQHKDLIYAICISPMMIPPISFGLGLLFLFGKNGAFFQLFGFRFPILGFWGIIIGQIFYTLPPTIILVVNGIKKTDVILYEEFSMDGGGIITFTRMILVPQIRKVLLYAFLLDFSMSLSDYTIPLVIGGRVKTLSLSIYRLAMGVLNLSQAARIGVILLIPVIFMVVLCNFILDYDYNTSFEFEKVILNPKRDFALALFMSFLCGIIIILFFSYGTMSIVKSYPLDKTICLDNFLKALSGKYLSMFFNSLYLAIGTSLIGITVAFGAAYISYREEKSPLKKICHCISCMPRVIPGILFGIGYAMIFNKTPLKGSFLLVALGCVFHFLTIPYTMALNGFASISQDYRDLESIFGLSFYESLVYVYIPYLKDILWDMYYYYFSNTMISISVPVFLSSAKTMPYSLILNNFEGSIEYLSNCSAVIMILLLLNGTMNFLICKQKRLPDKVKLQNFTCTD